MTRHGNDCRVSRVIARTSIDQLDPVFRDFEQSKDFAARDDLVSLDEAPVDNRCPVCLSQDRHGERDWI